MPFGNIAPYNSAMETITNFSPTAQNLNNLSNFLLLSLGELDSHYFSFVSGDFFPQLSGIILPA
jgi:hypothetical protein